jgi:hypothetical protein
MRFENIMLNKKSVTKDDIGFHLYEMSRTDKSAEIEVD